VLDLVARAVAEDLDGGEDVTSVATVPADLQGVAAFVPRADGTLAGVGVAMAVLDVVVPGAELRALAEDGDAAVRGRAVLEAEGPVRSLLTAERTALNLLCHLSGIATLTATWVDAVAGTGARIRDTRKTTPGLRALEKHAVRCGGGVNHRMSLSDAALVKDNHVVAPEAWRRPSPPYAGSSRACPSRWSATASSRVREVLDAGADLVLARQHVARRPALLRRPVQRARGCSRGLRRPVARRRPRRRRAGVDFSRSARSPTPPRFWTWVLTSDSPEDR
jgi:nicotinate-nucleotide pyrophosphorylase (carboxylating)